MFRPKDLNLSPEEEVKAIKGIIKLQTNAIAKNLRDYSYKTDHQKLEVDLLCLFVAVYSDFHGIDKADILYQTMMDNIQKKYH
jgi:hypothetical protein